MHPAAGPAGGRRRDEGDVGGGCPPVSGGNGSQMCVSGEEGAWTRTAPLRAPTVPQPLCWRWGGCPRRLRTNSIGALRVGVGGFCRSPSPPGRRGGEGPGWGGRAERGAGGSAGRGRAASSMTGLCLSCLLWVRLAHGGAGRQRRGVPGARSGAAPGAGGGWDWMRGERTERRRLRRDGLTGSRGNWRGWTGTRTGCRGAGTERRPPGSAGHRGGAGGTGLGAGPGGARGPWGAARDPARERSGGGQQAGGYTKRGPGWDAGQGRWAVGRSMEGLWRVGG